MLNRPPSINEDAISRMPSIECNVRLNEFPTVMETKKAIQHLSSGKAPGAGAISAEIYKAGGLTDRVVSMHVEEEGYPTRIQGCIHNPSVQMERKSTCL